MKLIKKIVVIAIIGLFFGVGVNPSIANSKYKKNLLQNLSKESIPPPRNSPPIACYDCSNYYPRVNQKVLFDASCSYDPDGGSITDYYWYYCIEHMGLIVPMGYGEELWYSFSLSFPDWDYLVTLKITDDEGDNSSICKHIHVHKIKILNNSFLNFLEKNLHLFPLLQRFFKL